MKSKFSYLLLIFVYTTHSNCQVNTENMRSEKSKLDFTNTVKLNFGYELSKEEIFNLMLAGRSDYFGKNNFHIFLISNYQNGYKSINNNKEIINNKGFSHFRITKNIFPKLSFEFFLQKGFNDFILIKDRKLIGTGIRTQLVNKNKIKSFIGNGLMQEAEEYDINSSKKAMLIRSTNYSTLNFFLNDDVSMNNIIYYQPSIKNIKDYRILLDNEINFRINDTFSINTVINYRFDNRPHENSVKSYFQISNGFELNFQ